MALSTIQNNSFADTAVHGRRNLIINGAMQVAQRGTSETGVSTSQYVNACDRFKVNGNNGTWTISQDTDAPDGFSNSFKMLLTATETIGSTSYWAVEQKIEGQNLQGLAYGTSSAKTVTVSFYVKSNITGTYCLNLYQDDGTKNFPKTYTIDTANTWERKTISFVGDTATALDNDNASSLRTTFFVVAGSGVNSGTPGSRVAYTNATWAAGQTAQIDAVNDFWQITGVQLEVGETATPFEHKSYGDELARCQRYLKLGGAGVYGIYNSAANIEISIPLNPNMRAAPTLSMAKTTVTISNKTNSNTATATSVSAVNISSSPSGVYFAQIGNCNVTSASAGHIAQFRTDEFLQLDAEL